MKLNESVGSIDWKFTMKGKYLKFNTHLHCLISPKMENFTIPSRKCWCLTEDANITPLKNNMEHNHEDLVHRNIRWFVLGLQPFIFGARYYLSQLFEILHLPHPLQHLSGFVLWTSFGSIFNQQKSNNKNGTCRIPTTKIPHGTYPGSSKCVKFVPFHQKNYRKAEIFTDLEDPGMYITNQRR